MLRGAVYTSLVPHVVYPSIPDRSTRSLWTMFWLLLWFALSQIALWLWFAAQPPAERLPYYTTIDDVTAMIERMERDPRPTVAFVGGSVVWGASTPEETQTIPAAFARQVPQNVGVYNFGLVGARPFDELLLLAAIRDAADMIIMDYNYVFGLPLSLEDMQADRGTYLRLKPLLDRYGDDLFRLAPATESCLQTYDIAQPAAQHSFEAILQTFLERWLPIFRYRSRIHAALIGAHPTIAFEEIVLRGANVLSGQLSFAEMWRFAPPVSDTGSWVPTDDAAEEEYVAHLQTTAYPSDSFHACLLSAAFPDILSTLPLFRSYLTPLNPRMFPEKHVHSVYTSNIAVLREEFQSVPLLILDDRLTSGEAFSDSTHLTPAGNESLAEVLYDAWRTDFPLSSRDAL